MHADKSSMQVIADHVRILRASRFTRPQVDVLLDVYIENLCIVATAQARLDRVTRLNPLHRDELVSIVDELLEQLDQWWRRHGDWLDASTRALDDHTRAAIPFHHARFFILDSAFARMPTEEQFAADPHLLGYALDAYGQGKAVLDLASQSKIWHSHLPFAGPYFLPLPLDSSTDAILSSALPVRLPDRKSNV